MVIGIVRRAKFVRFGCLALSLSALSLVALTVRITTQAEAKTPGSTYCYHGVCHRVKTIEETHALVGREHSVFASHYDDCKRDRYNPCGLTSSGESFHPDRPDNTASPIYPDGTTLLVWNPETERALVVRVNNAGPYHGNRKLDLSRGAAEKLGFEGKGVTKLHVKVVKAPEPEEAKYSKRRSYAPVPGDIGEYSSVEEAERGMAVAYALQASATSLLAPVTARAFSTPDHKVLVAEAPRAHSSAPARFASAHKSETRTANTFDTSVRNAASVKKPEAIALAQPAEIEAVAVTESVTAREPQIQVAAAASTAAAPKAQPVGKASRKKKSTRTKRSSKRKTTVASRRSKSRNRNARGRRSAGRDKPVRTAALRSKQPRRYKFHANSISEFHHRHMRSASSRG